MDIGKAFSYVFEDAQWIAKTAFLALFFLLAFLLVGVPFLIGYQLQIIRNVHRGEPLPLPEWTDLGGKFVDGLKLFAVMVVYMLPYLLLYCCSMAIQLGLTGAAGSSDNSGLAGIVLIVSLLLTCVQFIYALVIAILAPAITIQYARTGDIAASLRIGEVIKLVQALPGPYVIAVLMTGIALPFIGSLGVILCIIGIFFTYPYVVMVGGHILGQLWRQLDTVPQTAK